MAVSVSEGSGPPIVLIAQLGCGGDIWQPIVDRLAGLRVVTYDRPGTGNASPRPAPNPPLPHSAFADELAALLAAEGLTEPSIVAGHSFGGLIARQYAARHPHRIAGLVMVDSSIPPFHLNPSVDPIFDGDGPDATEIDVLRGHLEVLEGVLPAVPALVLARAHGTWSGTEPPPHPAVEDLWRAYQRLLARDLSCPLIAADQSGHHLHRDAPDLVAYAVRAVHRAAASGTVVTVDQVELAKAGGHLDT